MEKTIRKQDRNQKQKIFLIRIIKTNIWYKQSQNGDWTASLCSVVFFVLKLSTKIEIPQRGKICPWSPQFLPLLSREGQDYLSLSGINTRYHTPFQTNFRFPSCSNPWGTGSLLGWRTAALLVGRKELSPPCQVVSCVDTLLVRYSYPSLLVFHMSIGFCG